MAIYAVRKGQRTGKFPSWEACKRAVEGYSGAEYKKFNTEEEANAYLGILPSEMPRVQDMPRPVGKPVEVEQDDLWAVEGEGVLREDIRCPEGHNGSAMLLEALSRKKQEAISINLEEGQAIAFTDGSFNREKGIVGFGCMLYTHDSKRAIAGCDTDDAFAQSANVSCEVMGAILAVKEAVRVGCTSLKICYNYKGIGYWATGDWKAKSPIAQLYVAYLNKISQYIDLEFEWVGKQMQVNGDNIDRIASDAINNGSWFSIYDFFMETGLV